jgi:small subunit ribosomal protein S6
MAATQAARPNRFYEGVVILHPDTNEEQQKAFFSKAIETIKSFKGSLNHVDTWGKRRLANSINKMKLGTYFHFTFEAQPACVTELERTFRIDERILRFSHVRLDERVSLADHVEKFKTTIIESNKREQEREAKRDLRRRESAAMGGRPGPGPGYGAGGPKRNESRPGGRFSNLNKNEEGADEEGFEDAGE